MNISSLFFKIRNDVNFRNTLIYTFFSFFSNGLNFVILFVLSLVLSKDDFGILNLFNVYILIISVVISLGTPSFFGVSYFKENKEYIKSVVSSVVVITVIMFILICLVLNIFSSFFTSTLNFSTVLQVIGLTFCLCQVLYNFLLEYYRITEKSIHYGLISTAFILLNVITTYLFCISLNLGWQGRIYSQLISVIPFIIFFYIIFKKNDLLNLKSINIINLKSILNFGLPLIPHSSATWMRQGFDRYFINIFHTSSVVANYSFIYNMIGIILMIGSAYNSSYSVFIFKILNEKPDNYKNIIFKQIRNMILIFLLISFLAFILITFIIKFFIPKYMDAIPFVFPLCTMAFFQCIYYLYVNLMFYYNKTKKLMFITLGFSLFHLSLSLILIKISPIYAGYINLVSTALITFFVYYYSKKQLIK